MNPTRLLLLLLALFLLLLPPDPPAACARPALCARVPGRSQDLPAGLPSFVEKLAGHVEKNEIAALEALAEPGPAPPSFAFLRQASLRGGTWKVAPLLIPAVAGQPPQPAVSFYRFQICESQYDRLFRLTTGGEAGWHIGSEIPEIETMGYRVRDHRLTVRYNLPGHEGFFTDEVTIERVRESARPLILRLSSDMQVDSVARNAQPFAAQVAPGFVALAPPADRSLTLSLTYHGVVNHPGSDYINEREAVLVSYWYPHIARLPTKHGVTVTVPKGWLAIGEGDPVGRSDDAAANTSTFSYRNEVSTCYFSLDAGPYAVTERTVDGRKLAAYQLRPDPQRATAGLEQLEKALRFFDASFGSFPYKHYTLVETIGPFGGALEAYSFATFGGGNFIGACAHEVAHTWWGGVVPNTYTRTLWNESFATYSDGLFHRLTGPDPKRRALEGQHGGRDRGRGALQAFAVPIRQAFDALSPAHNPVGYGKGSMVLAMLEDLLGTPVMLRCLRAFYEGHPRGEPAEWEDFIAAVRRITGRDYRWFFDQWLSRPGAPVVGLAKVRTTREKDRTVVEGEIVQQGTPYRLPLPVVLETRGGASVRQTVETRGAATRFRIASTGRPKRLALDPAGNILLAAAPAPEDQDPLSYSFPAGR